MLKHNGKPFRTPILLCLLFTILLVYTAPEIAQIWGVVGFVLGAMTMLWVVARGIELEQEEEEMEKRKNGSS